MANYETLKTAIQQVVKTNGNNEIKGALLQQSLLAMINSLGAGYQFIGVVTPATNPGTPDQKVFYVANGKGTYTNFGGISITEDEVVILYYDTAWHKLLTGIASQAKLSELEGRVEGLITDKVPLEIVQTINDKYISVTGELKDGPAYETIIYKVAKNNKLIINISGQIGTIARQYAIYTSLTTLDATTNLEVSGVVTNESFAKRIEQDDAVCLAITRYIKTGIVEVNKQIDLDLKNDIEQLEVFKEQASSDINDIKEIVSNLEETKEIVLPKKGVKSLWYITADGNLSDSVSSYSINFYEVSEGEKIRIKSTYNVGNSRQYAVYSTIDTEAVSSENLVLIGGLCSENIYDKTIDIPIGGKILAVVELRANPQVTTTKFVKVNRIERIEQKVDNLSLSSAISYTISADVLKIGVKHGVDKDFLVEMKRRGGNNLFDFSMFGIKANGKNNPTSDFEGCSKTYTITSDWHSPFQVMANDNADGDNKNGSSFNVYFTGGNHQYNNRGSGSTATARTSEVRFFADGREISSGSGYANNMNIRWVNYVQGYNTTKVDGSGREILQEIHTVSFDGTAMNETVELIPLENVTLKRWYGFQMTSGAMFNGGNQYIGSTNRAKGSFSVNSVAGSKECRAYRCFDEDTILDVFVDESLDMGKRTECDANGAHCSSSSAKMYHHIVVGSMSLEAYNSYWLCGGYKFMAK